MLLRIDHKTRYDFSEPQARVVQLLRMTPRNSTVQTVLNWRISVDHDARLREGTDGYGNMTTMLYLDGPITALEIIVSGEVLTEEHDGWILGVPETLPPLFYIRPTQLTWSDQGIIAFSQAIVGSVKDPLHKAELLNIALFERIRTITERTPKDRTAVQTLADSWGNVRDTAQLLISCARAVGIPARFVSGHRLSKGRAAGERTAHCWVELHIDGQGWFALDPTYGQKPDDSYVRVAIGLDAGDATPLSGTRSGGGIEALDVDVQVVAGGSHGQ
jgi:transglutaminase-like putative cysteine protease